MKKIIFDIETKNIFTDVGSENPADLDISVVCLYDSDKDQYFSFLEEDFSKMWPFFKEADLLVTYNGNHFDIPLLQKYTDIKLSEISHIDVFEKIREKTGRKIPLDSVAENTLGINKSGHGLDAVAWWNSGEIQKIIDYCIQDVKVTKEIYEFGLENNFLKYKDRKTAEVLKVEVDLNFKPEKKENSGLLF